MGCRALRRRLQVSSAQDAELHLRRNHLVQRLSAAADHAARVPGLATQLRDDAVHHLRHAGDEGGDSRLGVIGGSDLFPGRNPASLHRKTWRIHLQDLP